MLFWYHLGILKPLGGCFHFFVTKTPILSLLAGDDPPACNAQKLIWPFSLNSRRHRLKTLKTKECLSFTNVTDKKDIFKIGNFDIMSIGNTQEDTELKWPQLLVEMWRYSRFSDYLGSEHSLVQNSPFAGEIKYFAVSYCSIALSNLCHVYCVSLKFTLFKIVKYFLGKSLRYDLSRWSCF